MARRRRVRRGGRRPPRREQAGKPAMFAQPRADAFGAKVAKHHPQLRAKPAPELDARVHQVLDGSRSRKYSGTSENARRRTSMRRQYNALKSNGVKSHLCGLTTSESAASAPASTHRYRARWPSRRHAASTCSHTAASEQTSAIAATGSMLVDDVVPTVATTAIGSRPAPRSSAIATRRASARIENRSSTGMRRIASRPRPSVSTALSIDECVCSEQ